MSKKMFEDYEKILVRDEIKKEPTDLEKILDLETEIVRSYGKDDTFQKYDYDEIYSCIYNLVEEKAKEIKITPSLLQEYIDARENPEQNNIAIIRGMYSAALLEIICTTQPDTQTSIDGKGKTFNYLFFHIRNVKNLTLQNISGDNILRDAGSNGSCEHIIIKNVTGHETLRNAGWEGNATNIIISNLKGHNTLRYAGRNNKESLKYVSLSEIRGDHTLGEAGNDNGSVEHVTAHKIEGYYTFHGLGENGGRAKHILQENDFTAKQKKILSRIESIVETIHTLSLEKQKKAHDEIAKLQEEIFAEEEK